MLFSECCMTAVLKCIFHKYVSYRIYCAWKCKISFPRMIKPGTHISYTSFPYTCPLLDTFPCSVRVPLAPPITCYCLILYAPCIFLQYYICNPTRYTTFVKVEYVRGLWKFLPQPPNVGTHRATHNLHIPNQQHTVYRRSWGCTCRSETCGAVKHIVNKYSTITKVCLVGLRT